MNDQTENSDQQLGIYQAMSTLRAVRRQRPDPIPNDVLMRVLEAATWAPTGGNRVPWRILAVRDPKKKKGLRDLYKPEWDKYAQVYENSIGHLEGAARAKEERTLAAATELAEHFDRSPVILIFCFNTREMAITDLGQDRPSVVGGGSIYPSVQNALLACRAEGLGCTITTLLCLREPEVKQLLGIPEDWYTAAAVPIGYPVGGGHGPISRPPVEKVAFLDNWGSALTETELG